MLTRRTNSFVDSDVIENGARLDLPLTPPPIIPDSLTVLGASGIFYIVQDR